MEKLKSLAMIKKAQKEIEAEYAKLPQISAFGTNNRANLGAKRKAFSFLLHKRTPSLSTIHCRIYDIYSEKEDAGESENPESEYDEEIRVLEWAIGVQSNP